MTLDDLKKQLAHTQAEYEQCKITAVRLEGMIMLLQHQIKESEAPTTLDVVPDVQE